MTKDKRSVPDPKLLILDQDPQNEDQEFWIRILLDARDGEKKFSNLVILKTQMG